MKKDRSSKDRSRNIYKSGIKTILTKKKKIGKIIIGKIIMK